MTAPSDASSFSTEGTFRISVKVIPAASSHKLSGRHGDEVTIKIAAPPEKGKANKALVDFLSDALGVPKKTISLIRGETSQHKVLLLPVRSRPDWERLISAVPRK